MTFEHMPDPHDESKFLWKQFNELLMSSGLTGMQHAEMITRYERCTSEAERKRLVLDIQASIEWSKELSNKISGSRSEAEKEYIEEAFRVLAIPGTPTKIHESPFRAVFHLESDQNIVIKLQNHIHKSQSRTIHTKPSVSVQKEALNLEAARAATSKLKYKTLAALDYYEELDGYTLEYVPDKNMQDILLTSCELGTEEKYSSLSSTDWHTNLSEALSMIHAAGIIHGSISTDNIFLSEDNIPYLAGFSKSLSAEDISPSEFAERASWDCHQLDMVIDTIFYRLHKLGYKTLD